MTVRELIELLNTVEDQNRIVILASGAEGNGFADLTEINTAA